MKFLKNVPVIYIYILRSFSRKNTAAYIYICLESDKCKNILLSDMSDMLIENKTPYNHYTQDLFSYEMLYEHEMSVIKDSFGFTRIGMIVLDILHLFYILTVLYQSSKIVL